MQGSGWPANELEQVLGAALGRPDAGPQILDALGRSRLWVPLPHGGSPDHAALDLPTMLIGGEAYVPVYSSEAQFRHGAGPAMDFAIAPAVEFARGLPPQLGIAVNPEGAVGVPLPPPPSPSCAAPAGPRSTDPPPAAASGSSSPTGRRTPSTSWPPRPRSSAPRAWSPPRTAASPASRPAPAALHRRPAGGMGSRDAERPAGGPRPRPGPRTRALARAVDPPGGGRGPGHGLDS